MRGGGSRERSLEKGQMGGTTERALFLIPFFAGTDSTRSNRLIN